MSTDTTEDTARANPAPGMVAPADERVRRSGPVKAVLGLPGFGAAAGAIVVFAFFTIATPLFVTVSGIANWLDPSSTIGLVAVAVAFLMIGGEFDISAGVMIGSTGLVTGLLAVNLGVNMWLAMAGSLVFAVLVGMFNGFMVTRTKLPSFIITLGTFFILQGLNLGVIKLVTGTVRVNGLDSAPGYHSAYLLFASTISIGGANVQVAILWWVVITAVLAVVLAHTRIGNWITSVGGVPEAARGLGVPVAKTKIGLFVGVSVMAWFVGVITALRLTAVTSNQGVGQELIFIVAAVVGGCLLTGGYGSIIGASLGALIFGMAQVGIPDVGWNSDWYYAFLGAMLLLAVLVNTAIRKRFQVGIA